MVTWGTGDAAGAVERELVAACAAGASSAVGDIAARLGWTAEHVVEALEDALTYDPLPFAGEDDELSGRQVLVLHMRFSDGLAQSEIAARLGTSPIEIARLIRRGLDRLTGAAGATGAEAPVVAA